MQGINKVVIVGNLTADAELRSTQSGHSILSFKVAVNERFKGRDGEWQDRVEFIGCVLWGGLGPKIVDRMRKGTPVYAEGKFTTRHWEDKQGNKRYTSEVNCSNVMPIVADGGERAGNSRRRESEPPPQDDDPIPF